MSEIPGQMPFDLFLDEYYWTDEEADEFYERLRAEEDEYYEYYYTLEEVAEEFGVDLEEGDGEAG